MCYSPRSQPAGSPVLEAGGCDGLICFNILQWSETLTIVVCGLQRSKVENHLQQALTPEQRRMRSETLRRTMMLLEHAASCNNPNCASKSCRKVKKLHLHYQTCTKRTQGNCSYCRHLMCLLSLHAKRCTRENCPVPECGQYRQMRQHQAAQQEAMRRQQYVRIRGMNPAAARA